MILRQAAAIGDPSSRQAHEPFDECRCWAGAVGVVRGGLALTRLLPLAGGVIIGVGAVIAMLAIAAGAPVIVSRNTKDLARGELRFTRPQVQTPEHFVKEKCA